MMTLPLRVGARAARLSLYTAEEALRLSRGTANQAIKFFRSPSPQPRPATAPERAPRATEPYPYPAPPVTPPRPAEAADPPPLTDEPVHVSREAVVVEEVAEAGAEDGAGAELHVDEPWPDYGRMTTKDIVARLEQADPAELAAVELYEQAHRARQSVLTVAERRLRTASRGGTQQRHERKANHGR
jgi:hypothetical protein